MSARRGSEPAVTPVEPFGRVPERLLLAESVTSDECRLYAYFTTFDRGMHKQAAWPGDRRSADELGWSLSKLERVKRRLVDRHAISVRRRGQGKTAILLLMFDVKPWVDIGVLQTPDGVEMDPDPSDLTTQDPSLLSPDVPDLTGHTSLPIKELERKAPTLCPDPFLVDDVMQAWVRKECSHVDWELETKRFCNHFRGEGIAKKDWRATWRNWMLKAESQVPAWAKR